MSELIELTLKNPPRYFSENAEYRTPRIGEEWLTEQGGITKAITTGGLIGRIILTRAVPKECEHLYDAWEDDALQCRDDDFWEDWELSEPDWQGIVETGDLSDWRRKPAVPRRFEVGDLIEPIFPYRLACGSGIYSRAVLVSVDPFVAVSESGDMLWRATISPEKVKRIGIAYPEVLAIAMKRFER